MKAFGRQTSGWMRRVVCSRLVRAGSLAVLAVFATGLFVWLATPWPTLAARHAWGQWHAPRVAILLNQNDAALAMTIGNTYYGSVPRRGTEPLYNPRVAKDAFQKAVAIEPGILWGEYSLARIALTEGDLNAALAHINAELEANPENVRALYIRGLIYGYRNQPGDLYLAELDFKRFTKWAPSEWAGYNDLAWILAKEGKYAEVEGVATRAFTSVPGGKENPWFWNMLGVARLNLGDNAGASTAFTNALTYAGRLTPRDWREAYSGNSPTEDQTGLDTFLAGIRENLATAGGSS